ncbi:DUF2855 family protein [uncultured Piscinibacter sp.]|uniref:DUF2855 family protein n=1 Tax=uncultured Piscinibacter sp. TaxID=1131835 RepID=UPI0026393A5B|nr:DUF2855 family protein [uncultured Piscinibacter sp.]
MTLRLLIDRQHLHEARWDETPSRALAEGELRLRIDRFALTANNITYAAFGEAMRYWDFFPSGDASTGCLPVWGFGSAVESRHPSVQEGERFYGYFPVADELIVQPARANAAGFLDGAEHRRALHTIYNHYARCSTDPGYRADREAEQVLLRPLFTTSFLIDDFLADNGGFGAQQVLLSSASSKTAYGTAFCLAQRRGLAGALRTIGLTSSNNLAFTRSLGCYDAVLSYDEMASLDTSVPTVYVDFSGSARVRRTVHEGFGDRLAYSCSVGGTHWDELGAKGAGRDLPGPRPTLFFAPAQASKRIEQWGAAGLQQRLAEAWNAFMKPVTSAQPPWLKVVEGAGTQAVEAVYRALLDGTAAPQDGHVLTLAR